MLGQQPIIVSPGEFAEVKMDLLTGSLYGSFKKDLAIITDSAEEEYKLLPCKIVGEVIVPVKAFPDQVFLGTIDPGEKIVRKLEIIFHDTAMLKNLKTVKCSDPSVKLSTLNKTSDRLKLQVTFEETDQTGSISSCIELIFNNPEIAKFEIPIFGEIQGDLDAIPSNLVLRNKQIARKFKMKISSISNQDFRILDVNCPQGIETKMEMKKGESSYYVLTFAVSPTELSKADTSQSISIMTDNFKQEKLVIPVSRSW